MHIRIISPSGRIDSELIEQSSKRLTESGFVVSEGAYARGEYGRFAGSREERISDLQSALSDPDVDAVLCSRGGYGLQQIIDKAAVIVEQVESQKVCLPLLIGFSDITCMHSLYALSSTPSLHGPMCKMLAMSDGSESVSRWYNALRGEDIRIQLPMHPLQREGSVRGKMIGGNLSVLYGLLSTPWGLMNIIKKNKSIGYHNILFLEDICERHYHIDRMMQCLRLSGILSAIDGLVVGQMTDIDDDPLMRCSVQETIRDAVAGYDYPVVFGFPAGHAEENFPFFLNREAQLSVTAQGVAFVQQGYDI